MHFNNTVPSTEYVAGPTDGFYLVFKGLDTFFLQFVHFMFIVWKYIGNNFQKASND